MNQKILSGLTATLVISAFGLTPSGYATQPRSSASGSEVNSSEAKTSNSPRVASTSATADVPTQPLVQPSSSVLRSNEQVSLDGSTPTNELTPSASEKVPTQDNFSDSVLPTTPNSLSSATPEQNSAVQDSPRTSSQPAVEAVKVGEYQTQEAVESARSIATIHPHPLEGRQAATLYVRNIPVLTFLGATLPDSAVNNGNANVNSTENVSVNGAEVKVASVQTGSSAAKPARAGTPLAAVPGSGSDQTGAEETTDPIWRATAAAALINQLYRDNVSADQVRIVWDETRDQYVILADETEIVVVDANTVLPDTVENRSSDILQATNRIRRQMGNASPLSNIEGEPEAEASQMSLGSLQIRVSGFASWYGPGFDGNYSASGEVFNQEAMTAAHPSLPFGTQVRVTNLDNGQSVVVRINDRGPFVHDRLIDLSAGAARIIGLLSAGVAPVSLEVLGAAQASN